MAILAYYEALLRKKVQGAIFNGVGGIFLLIGTGFLAAALWMVLAEVRDAKFAATVMGFGFVALGFVAMGVGPIVSRMRIRHMPAPRARVGGSPMFQLLEGFLVGIDAGRRSRRR